MMIPTDITPVAFVLAIFVALMSGGFASTIWSTFTGKRARKVDEVTSLSQLKSEIMDEIRQENLALDAKLGLVAEALIDYTDTVDSFMNRVEGIPLEERRTLHQAGNKARLVLSRLVA